MNKTKVFLTFVITFSIILLILKGYNYSWTGFGSSPISTTDSGLKTLWDWLELLIVPIVLAVGGFLYDNSRKRSDLLVEKDRQQQEILDQYFTYISELLIENNLLGKDVKLEIKDIARTRTLAAIRLLDGSRKSQLLQFLYETKLILKDPIIQLNGADFSDINLDRASLTSVELRGANFIRASVKGAYLINCDFRGSDFSYANFEGSDLSDSKFKHAKFFKAQFKKSNRSGIDFPIPS